MPDVLCLGEILVDWVCTTHGADLAQATSFTKAPGGAPANTAVGLARLGVPTAFIGRVSRDEFGKWLRRVLEENDVDTEGLIDDSNAQTRMAYVVTTMSGDRKLADFTRIACADSRLEPGDLLEEQFRNASILHFGSISLIENPAREATERAVSLARQSGMLISYDPNVRLSLWKSPEHCKETILKSLPWSDIVKINEDELEFLTGSRKLEEADKLRKDRGIKILLVTLDERGAYLSCREGGSLVPGFTVDLKEATGAGDGFNAGIISSLLDYLPSDSDKALVLENMNKTALEAAVRKGNAIGALTCTKAGAIPALPTKAELEAFFRGETLKSTSK